MTSDEVHRKVPFKTYCVGRLMLELPDGAEFKWGPVTVGAIPVEQIERTANVEALVASRVKELSVQEHRTKGTMFIQNSTSDGQGSKISVLEFWEDDRDATDVKYEGYRKIGNSILRATTSEGIAEEGRGSARPYVITALKAFKVNDNPQQSSGACFGDVFLNGTEHKRESAQIFVVWEKLYPGLSLSIKMDAFRDEVVKPVDDVSLLTRASERDSMARKIFPGSDYLRRRSRSVGAWKIEEVGIADKDRDGDVNFTFMLEARQPKPGFATPSLDMELKSPGPKFGKLNEDEVLAVWDVVVDSIRPRSTPH